MRILMWLYFTLVVDLGYAESNGKRQLLVFGNYEQQQDNVAQSYANQQLMTSMHDPTQHSAEAYGNNALVDFYDPGYNRQNSGRHSIAAPTETSYTVGLMTDSNLQANGVSFENSRGRNDNQEYVDHTGQRYRIMYVSMPVSMAQSAPPEATTMQVTAPVEGTQNLHRMQGMHNVHGGRKFDAAAPLGYFNPTTNMIEMNMMTFQPSGHFYPMLYVPPPQTSHQVQQTSLTNRGPHLFPTTTAGNSQSAQTQSHTQALFPSNTPSAQPQLFAPSNSNPSQFPLFPTHFAVRPHPNLLANQFQPPFRPSQFVGYTQDQAQRASKRAVTSKPAAAASTTRPPFIDPAIASGRYYHRYVKPIHEQQRERAQSDVQRPPRQNNTSRLLYMAPSSMYAVFKSKQQS